MKKLILIIQLLLFSISSYGQSGNLYTTTLLRAAPGNLSDLIDFVKQEREKAGGDILVMRHSQGDHWDLMLLSPFNGIETIDYKNFVDFQHDFVVSSDTDWDELKNLHQDNGLYHIEMFHAPKGRHEQLLEQRKMENVFLREARGKGNIIFVTRFGSDVDNYTIGFYKDFPDFAKQPDMSQEELDQAAQQAGFESVSGIGIYLRRFMLKHNDTIATSVE